MSDSVDRVFVHALNTVKKIPRTGSARPPAADRLRLYGLYKQAMEGNVDGVMERPKGPRLDRDDNEDTIKDQEKWDAWDSQQGLSKIEAKRRYIEALIETMHKYASTTADARELVAELEFVWDQVKNNSLSSSNSSPSVASQRERSQGVRYPQNGAGSPMKVLSPRSQEDEAEVVPVQQPDIEDREEAYGDGDSDDGHNRRGAKTWRRKVEAALVKMTAEMAALREQIGNERGWRERRRGTIIAWFCWLIWMALQHIFIDTVLLGVLLLWMRRRKDRRLESFVREVLRAGREYLRQLFSTQ